MTLLAQAAAFVAVVVAGLLAARQTDTSPLSRGVVRVMDWLQSAWAPVLAGAVSGACVLVVWGSLRAPAVIHDEQAYLLQARIFASGAWTTPTPALPEFFERMHVFMRPAVFAKYPPAHALLLVPGIWFGLPGLVPVLLSAVSGALVFWLARRHAGAPVALLTWALWTTSDASLYWRASYFSEVTSGAAWLAAAWACTRWWDTRRGGWLVLAAAVMAVCVLARPLTGAALSVPLALVAASRILPARLWREAAAAMLVALALLLLWSVWNAKTLGGWQHDPYSEYSRVYFPFDAPGFGFDATPPRVAPPPELQAVGEQFVGVHTRYTPSAMPVAMLARVLNALLLAEQAWRYVLVALLLVGAAVAAPAVRLAWGSTLLLFVAYLSFAHPPGWGVYYIDVLPACDFLIAVGTVRVMEAAHQGGRTKAGGQGPAEAGHDVLAPRHAVAAVLCALAWLPFMVRDVVQARGMNAERARFHVRAEAALAPLAGQRAVVFVHYPAGHDFNKMITPHGPDLMAEPLWIVTDRGPRDQALLAAAGGRAAWDFDVAAGTLSPRATP